MFSVIAMSDFKRKKVSLHLSQFSLLLSASLSYKGSPAPTPTHALATSYFITSATTPAPILRFGPLATFYPTPTPAPSHSITFSLAPPTSSPPITFTSTPILSGRSPIAL